MKTDQIEEILEKLEKVSLRAIVNRPLVKEYLKESLLNSTPITFFNWECPPRVIGKTTSGKPYVDYDVDLSLIKKGEKFDDFTELPRVIEKRQDEVAILEYLKSLGIKFRFVKLVADTNSKFLTPNSLEITSSRVVNKRLAEFRSLIKDGLATYPASATALSFWELLRGTRLTKIYKEAFKTAYLGLKSGSGGVSSEIIEAQVERTQDHVGITDPGWALDFSLRTIATYGAEGIVFCYLSKFAQFSNCVWLNLEEVSERTITITNFLRRRQRRSDLPMIFPDARKLVKDEKGVLSNYGKNTNTKRF